MGMKLQGIILLAYRDKLVIKHLILAARAGHKDSLEDALTTGFMTGIL